MDSSEALKSLRADLLRAVRARDDAISALRWVARNYEATLAGKPVRDADECLERARLVLHAHDTRAGVSPDRLPK